MPMDLDPLANVGGSAPAKKPEANKPGGNNPGAAAQQRRKLARFQNIEFTGSQGEYFSLWFTTWVMTILTGGGYGPWGKVKLKAYLYNNTVIDRFGLGYHATGGQIMKGRIIAFIITLLFIGITQYYRPSLFVIAPLSIFIAPLAMNSALKFRAKNISWRNIRFHWNGTYWGTMNVMYIGPFVSLVTLGLLYPVMSKIYYNYYANHHSLGETDFDADLSIGECYLAFFISLLGGSIVAGAVFGAAYFMAPILAAPGESTDILEYIVYVYAAGLFVFQTSYMALCRNFMVRTLRLGRIARFESNISPLGYMGVKISNGIIQLLSLGFLTPLTVVREYQYLISCSEYKIVGDIEKFVDKERYAQSAFGEEFSEFEGLEMSI